MSNKNLVGYIKKMMEDKAEYREQMARLKKLPADYQIVYNEIQKFLWEFTAGDGMDMLSAMYELLDFLKKVLQMVFLS